MVTVNATDQLKIDPHILNVYVTLENINAMGNEVKEFGHKILDQVK